MDKITISVIILSIVLGVSVITLLKLFIYQSGNIVLHNTIKDVETYSPVPITNVLVFGRGDSIALPICTNDWINVRIFNNGFYISYNGFYVPSNISITDIYYKANSTSIGDYIPSLIGQKVYLIFGNLSAPYIVKSEVKTNLSTLTQGTGVFWTLIFNGNINNSINISNMNYTMQNQILWKLKGIVLQNGTALISPYTNTGGTPNCSLHKWRNDIEITALIVITLTALIIGLVILKIKKK